MVPAFERAVTETRRFEDLSRRVAGGRRLRLAVFVDQLYWFDGRGYSTNEAYMGFLESFAEVVDRLVILGRLAPERARGPYSLEHHSIQMCPLPYYRRLWSLWWNGPWLLREVRRVVRAQAKDWDVVWVGGPNPVADVIADECLALGVPVFFVVRENLVEMMNVAHLGLGRMVAVSLARWLQERFFRLARGQTVFTVGQEVADLYRRVTRKVHLHFPSLVRRAEVTARSSIPVTMELGRLLYVGRLSREKGVHHLLAAMSPLISAGEGVRLDVVGDGPERERLEAQSRALKLNGAVTFHGHVRYGPPLFDFYRKASALVAPSLTEGFPQVIAEALSFGVPVIASAVGGIPGVLKHRESALLVPAGDRGGLQRAIGEVLSQPDLQQRLREQGRVQVRNLALEPQRDQMLEIIQDEVCAAQAVA